MAWPIWLYSNSELGIDVSYEKGKMASLHESNYALTNLRTEINNKLSIYAGKYSVQDEIRVFKGEGDKIRWTLQTDGYAYLAPLENKLTTYGKSLQEAIEIFTTFQTNYPLVIEEIDEIVKNNKAQITGYEDDIAEKRMNAYRKLD